MINNKPTAEIFDIILLTDKDKLTDFKNDDFFLEEIVLENDILKVNVSYNGGCKKHQFFLVAKKKFYYQIKNTFKINLQLFHNANQDSCKKIVTEDIFFNLVPLKNEFQKNNIDQKNNNVILSINNISINYK